MKSQLFLFLGAALVLAGCNEAVIVPCPSASMLSDTASLTDVREKLRDLVSGELKPAYVGLALLEGRELRRIQDPAACYPVEMMTPVFSLFGNWPSSLAVRERRIVVVPDRDALLAQFGPEALAAFDAGDLRSAVCVPLRGTTRVVGVLNLGWDRPHLADVTERAVLTAIAGYTALAVERALYLDERITVAQLRRARPGAPDGIGESRMHGYRGTTIGKI